MRQRPRGVLLLAVVLAAVSLTAKSVWASGHAWEIVEVFSNEDGSVQYIELFTIFGSQEKLGGRNIAVERETVIEGRSRRSPRRVSRISQYPLRPRAGHSWLERRSWPTSRSE